MIFDLIFYCKTYDIIYALKLILLISVVGFICFGLGLILGYLTFGGKNGKRTSGTSNRE